MSKFRAFVILMFILVLCAKLDAEVPRIAVEPYKASVNQLTGEVRVWGQKIVHRAFDVELLEDRIQQVPIFAIQYEGLHHAKRNGKAGVEARAKCISERLAVAWDFLDKGGYLIIAPDDWTRWRVSGLTAPEYAPAPPVYPAIYITHSNLGDNPLRIMTVYPQDAIAVAKLEAFISGSKAAEYIVAIISAHHLLFSKKSNDICKRSPYFE